MFSYVFMQKAFIIGALIAVIIPCIGMIVVLKRLSMIGDALSHTSLAGVALGLIFGFDPIIGAVAACIFAALGIEFIRKKLPKFSEMSIAIIMSAGIGLAGFLTTFIKQPANFNSYLFGSIIAISDTEFYLTCVLAAVVLVCFLLFYKELFYIAFDERAARLSGVPVKSVNLLFTVMTAITVSVASRTIGALIVSSIMVIPVACSMQFNKNFKLTLILSCLFAVAFTFGGLTLSYHADFKPGSSIVLIGVVFFVLILIAKKILSKGKSYSQKGKSYRIKSIRNYLV